MSVDKFGRSKSGQIQSDSGVSIRYVNNNFMRKDDSRTKPVITIWAQKKGRLNSGNYEWSFGGGDTFRFGGYCMPASGRILRGSISSTNEDSGPDATSADRASVSIVINGQTTSNIIIKPAGKYSFTTTFTLPVEVAKNDAINFYTNTNSKMTCHIVSLLIQLDL